MIAMGDVPTQTTGQCVRKRLTVTGIVQGVGFRPFVYRLAEEHKLSGFTLNDSRGVTIELQGDTTVIDRFVSTLTQSPPPLARIDTLALEDLAPERDCRHFHILESESDSNAQVAVPADKSSCPDCLAEIEDPGDRHYQYPFTNCTNCGPRYTLIDSLPYDRKNTSMATFSMCHECARAYQDPVNRRYHAQPVSCPQCGPQLTLRNVDGSAIATERDALSQTIERLKAGEILAIKGLGGFHLVCDATNHQSVLALRERKQRPAKPFAVMCADRSMAEPLALGTELEWQMLCSAERPIVLMTRNDAADLLSAAVAPGLDKLGLFLPYTPLHHLLLAQLQRPLVATSANRSGEPIITEAGQIAALLGDVVDAVLDHDRIILNGCDDSVVQIIDGELQLLRMARGYAPLTLLADAAVGEHTLAVGAQQKNAIAFGFGRNIILSPHIGDLYSIEAEQYFLDTLSTFRRLYQFNPTHLVRDMHPGYAPSQWAKQYAAQTRAVRSTQVQHHFAHVLSVMAANNRTDTVLGFSFDGTGLGDDGRLWGGEALLADISGYQHIATFKPLKLIGGEQAIKDPRRIMLSLLFEQYSLEQVLAMPVAAVASIPETLIHNLHQLWSQEVATVTTSSAGRLFDAVACLLGLVATTQYEGEAGMLLEAAANRLEPEQVEADPLRYTLPCVDGIWQTDELWSQIVESFVSRPNNQATRGIIARAFMVSLADAMTGLATAYRHLPVVLCGGVFQNRYLSTRTRQQLKRQGNICLPSQQVPINDGGIALGQLWFGIHREQNANSGA